MANLKIIHANIKNPPEAWGATLNGDYREINGLEFNILAAGPFSSLMNLVSFELIAKTRLK
ncbi:MAG: hypothetical protein IPH94_19020 [Saprospiraceae bacterium]|nr:hypothetical protein [Saprospiraceae bacterium]